jgi:hypothetical protein
MFPRRRTGVGAEVAAAAVLPIKKVNSIMRKIGNRKSGIGCLLRAEAVREVIKSAPARGFCAILFVVRAARCSGR